MDHARSFLKQDWAEFSDGMSYLLEEILSVAMSVQAWVEMLELDHVIMFGERGQARPHR